LSTLLPRIIGSEGRGVKDKAFPGKGLPGFAVEGKNSLLSDDFPLNQPLTKKLWICMDI
jgi:hypothetical protein